jgi:tRNA U34 2-thiouridine synthase MnmA/TrmU
MADPGPAGVTEGVTDAGLVVCFDRPERRVAPGQTVALYDENDHERVVGSGVAW